MTTYSDAKMQEGKIMTILEMDNYMSNYDNDSLFGCGEGFKSLLNLLKTGISNFSYEGDSSESEVENYYYNGFCVEFELTNLEKNENAELGDDYFYAVRNIEIRITSVFEH